MEHRRQYNLAVIKKPDPEEGSRQVYQKTFELTLRLLLLADGDQ